ncbi:hypothetical protein [Pseudomonas mosselii]|uniref:Uncharacterized protein n=1 Tax=Pseudomonas mosselii TaxID=78327 RepID=A0ABX9AX32_9PSED|nr:hypothetical protein [Pseudomonas mosselii]MBC3458893.1 hypothetical protein [Pseudomonas mosselii]MBH3309479.1 hypothetical protein [Pseudomonas mosselii]MBH3325663.1 hypothetical protein [Pseudomonas mosselii]MCL8298707.1 hypothetical protein [Pseudomonas mosselii]MCL8338821.1 hypothetical protein [Pseudomonas mosselii]
MALPEKRQGASALRASSGNCQAAKAAKQKIDVKGYPPPTGNLKLKTTP